MVREMGPQNQFVDPSPRMNPYSDSSAGFRPNLQNPTEQSRRAGIERGLGPKVLKRFQIQFGVAALALLGLLFLPGCPPRHQAATQVVAPPPEVMPTYGQVVERYNANAGRIDRLWCHAEADITWRQHDKTHYEQGDGVLMVVLPDRTSFSLGKLGNTLLWAGADAQKYWLFDLCATRPRSM